MNTNFAKQLDAILTLVSKTATAINKRNKGIPNCEIYCPGEDRLISSLKEFLCTLKKVEPDCVSSIEDNLIILKGDNCLNPYAFGGILGVLNLLKIKYLSGKNDHKRIFISHSSKDVNIMEKFVDHILGLGIGINANDIFCSSIEGMDIKNGEDMRRHIQNNIRIADFSYLMISGHYKQSEICLNEMGAVWAYDSNVRIYMLPNTNVDKIGWLCNVRKGDYLNNSIVLDEIKHELCEYYNLPDTGKTWSRQRELFCSYLNKM